MEATYELVPRIEESFFFGELFTISRIKQILQNRVWVTWNLPVCRLVQLPGHLGHAPWAGTLCRLHYHHRAHNNPHLSGQCILVIIIIKSYSKSLTSSTRSVYSSSLHHGQYHSSPLSGQCTHHHYHCIIYQVSVLIAIITAPWSISSSIRSVYSSSLSLHHGQYHSSHLCMRSVYTYHHYHYIMVNITHLIYQVSVYSSSLHHGQYHSSHLSGQCTHCQYHNHPHHHLDCHLYYLNILKIIVVVVIIVFSFIINLVIFSCSKSSC